MNSLKLAAFGALATASLATAAIAQPKVDHRPVQEESKSQRTDQAMRGNMPGMEGGKSGMMAMMNNPEMRTEMMEMMRNCNEMMKMKQERMSSGKAG